MVTNFGENFRNHFDINKKIKDIEPDINLLHDKEIPLIKTGISCIDDGIIGIKNTDLMVIGAATNVGKTDIAKNIAFNVAEKDMKCVLFALECYEGEISDRIKWGEMMRLFYSEKYTPYVKEIKAPTYALWVNGFYSKSEVIMTIEKEAAFNITKKLKNNLYVRYRTPNEKYTVDVFAEEIDKIRAHHEFSLIIVDHLHYFGKVHDNENRDIENTVKTIRDTAMLHKVPVVLFSHFRKKTALTSVIPDIEEFHGSSEITKDAQTIVSLAPAYDSERPKDYLYPTYFRVLKEKNKTGAARYASCSFYDIRTGTDEKEYRVLDYRCDGTVEEIKDAKKIPVWANENSKLKREVTYEQRKKNS